MYMFAHLMRFRKCSCKIVCINTYMYTHAHPIWFRKILFKNVSHVCVHTYTCVLAHLIWFQKCSCRNASGVCILTCIHACMYVYIYIHMLAHLIWFRKCSCKIGEKKHSKLAVTPLYPFPDLYMWVCVLRIYVCACLGMCVCMYVDWGETKHIKLAVTPLCPFSDLFIQICYFCMYVWVCIQKCSKNVCSCRNASYMHTPNATFVSDACAAGAAEITTVWKNSIIMRSKRYIHTYIDVHICIHHMLPWF
jgi:hypothetical protein